MEILRSVVIVLIAAIVVGMIGGFVILSLNARQPEVRRKWTDPKFRDHIDG